MLTDGTDGNDSVPHRDSDGIGSLPVCLLLPENRDDNVPLEGRVPVLLGSDIEPVGVFDLV